MPSKKKKYNARFPPARIKKIMQTDEDVGKVAAAVPVIISRSLELFIESFIQKTATITKGRNAKTLSAAHIKQTIHSEKTFDFLRDLVVNVPDHQPDEDGDNNASSVPSCSTSQEVKKPKVPRPRKEKTGNGRGRPRKKDVIVKEETQEKEETESEDDDEEGSDSDSSQTNTDQFQASTDTSKTHPPIMQTPPQSGLQSGLHDPHTTAAPTAQTNPAFDSPASLANILPPSVPHNPLSPRLPQLQSPPQFSNMGMMPLPQLQSIPQPQFQNIPNQMLPPQQQYSGLTNQIPPPPSLTNFSNQLPVQPNFYPAHMSHSPQYPLNSQETFHSDQKSSFMMSRETPPFSSPATHFRPQLKQEEFNPANCYRNNIQNNEPLDMSKSSHSQRSPVTNHKSDQGNKTGMPISFPGLPNIMNMAAVPKPVTDDDDYDS